MTSPGDAAQDARHAAQDSIHARATEVKQRIRLRKAEKRIAVLQDQDIDLTSRADTLEAAVARLLGERALEVTR